MTQIHGDLLMPFRDNPLKPYYVLCWCGYGALHMDQIWASLAKYYNE